MVCRSALKLFCVLFHLICLLGYRVGNSSSLDSSLKSINLNSSIIHLIDYQVIKYSQQPVNDNRDIAQVTTSDDSDNIEVLFGESFFNAIDNLDITSVSNYLSYRGNVDAKRNGNTALIEVLIGIYLRGFHLQESTEILQLLIDKGADINARATGERLEYFKNQTALMIATQLNFIYSGGIEETVRIVQGLLDAGADTEMRVGSGQTVLMLKSRLEAGHNWNSIVNEQVVSMLISWFEGERSWNSIDIARTLLQNGANPNARDNNGWTALMHANYYSRNAFYPQTRKYNLQLTEVLLENGANPNIGSHRGITPLMLASRNSNISIIERLLEAGANPNAQANEGATSPLICAEEWLSPNFTIREILKEAGAIWPSRSHFWTLRCANSDLI